MMKYQVIDSKYNELVENIERYFNSSNDILHNARNQVKIIKFKNEKLVIKKFKKLHFLRSFIYSFFTKTKAYRSYQYSLKIKDATTKPIAYIENYHNKILTTSFFIAEYFEFDFDIRKPLLDKNFQDRENIFKVFAEFVYNLHNNNIYHLDLSPGNILIKQENKTYTFKIVDINRMVFKKLNATTRAKNFNKLWASDTDLQMILTFYNSHYNHRNLIKLGLKYNRKHKAIKNIKKKLRGQKIDD